mgnify:CR=1 FL=1
MGGGGKREKRKRGECVILIYLIQSQIFFFFWVKRVEFNQIIIKKNLIYVNYSFILNMIIMGF